MNQYFLLKLEDKTKRKTMADPRPDRPNKSTKRNPPPGRPSHGTGRTAKFTPRLSIDISFEQRDALDDLIPWGLKTKVFQALIDSLIETLSLVDEEKRNAFVGAIIMKKPGARTRDIMAD